MPDKLLPTSVRLAPDLLRSVRKAAEEQGCAVSFKIAQILREWEAREKRNSVRRGAVEGQKKLDPFSRGEPM